MIGESLSLYEEGDKKWAIMTPFAHPGDTIKAKIFKHDRFFSSADLVEILDYSEEYRGGEGDRRVNPEGGCKYFGEWYVTLPVSHCGIFSKPRWMSIVSGFSRPEYGNEDQLDRSICRQRQHGHQGGAGWVQGIRRRDGGYELTTSGGCQLQPLPYALQLLHKKKTVSLAYQRFSALNPTLIPEIQPTIGSPKQWGYRTKITPHFDAPPKAARAAKDARDAAVQEEEGMNQDVGEGKRDWECRIGFERKGRPGVLDIEVCFFPPQTLVSRQRRVGQSG
jgi:tRNA/tmRNA/rRNA uracil-C5-methylase (TrmA/RlmC/RlmD family)